MIVDNCWGRRLPWRSLILVNAQAMNLVVGLALCSTHCDCCYQGWIRWRVSEFVSHLGIWETAWEREREHAQENIELSEYWIKHYCKLSANHLTDVFCHKLVQSPQGKILTTYIVNDSILLVHTLTHSSLVKDYKLWLIISMKQRCHIYICVCCMSSSTHLENLYLYY